MDKHVQSIVLQLLDDVLNHKLV